nr:MAG TPA: hypothetical protein [Caudoviricetes sp.]
MSLLRQIENKVSEMVHEASRVAKANGRLHYVW